MVKKFSTYHQMENNMKCIFIDIDGTLYDHEQKKVHDSSLEAIRLARQNGHKVIIATGRSICESRPFLNLEVDGYIFCAGAIVYAEKKRLYRNCLETSELFKLADQLDHMEYGFALEGEAGAYYNDKGLPFILKYFHSSEIKDSELLAQQYGFYTMDHWDYRDGIGKMCIYGRSQSEIDKLAFLRETYQTALTLTDDKKEMYCLELSKKGHHKAFGAKKVLDYFNLDFEDAIAIGDSENDLELVATCKIGIAMGNATPKLKDVATFTTDSMSHDGIYNAFKNINIF